MSAPQAFSSIANVSFPSSARILPSSWCPDKDLLVLVARLGGKDRLSLWKMQGTKIWEVDVDADAAESATDSRIVDVAWSPDNLHIAVAHHPPLVTLHSIQDGRQERKLLISAGAQDKQHRLSNIWWYKEHRAEKKAGIPDIFSRNNIIPGSAHSILKTQPLLAALPDDSERLSATDLFAFRTTRTAAPASTLPPAIANWPTLPPDPALASIQPHTTRARPGDELDEADDSNVNSVLFAAASNENAGGDTGAPAGVLHMWLDGAFPLGAVALPAPPAALHKLDNATFLLHPASAATPTTDDAAETETALHPTTLVLPALTTPAARHVAQTASSARALVWYALRLVRELRAAWFGSAHAPGARALGPNWVRALETRQRAQFGADEPNAVLDLTVLLATGRAPESVTDYLGSGEQMSERGIQKWETTVAEALLKLRDDASRRIAPACQRVHVLLQEVQGWAQLPQYKHYHFDLAEVTAALELAARGVVCANWLAATARAELQHFKQFIAWVKYESQRATNLHNDAYTAPPPAYDPLDVAAYLAAGLTVSAIDRAFVGPVPVFPVAPGFGTARRALPLSSDTDPAVGGDDNEDGDKSKRLRAALASARAHLRTAPHPPSSADAPSLGAVDRNLDALVHDLAARCCVLFRGACPGVSRGARLSSLSALAPPPPAAPPGEAAQVRWVRERFALVGGAGVAHVAMGAVAAGQAYLLLLRAAPGAPLHAAAFACAADALDAQFFDADALVVVLRAADAPAVLGTVRYGDAPYAPLARVEGVRTREGLAREIVRRVQAGEVAAPPLVLHQSRTLAGCAEGGVALAVNGRVGRRVACVLGGEGTAMEVLDMEGEEEEEEEEEGEEEV